MTTEIPGERTGNCKRRGGSRLWRNTSAQGCASNPIDSYQGFGAHTHPCGWETLAPGKRMDGSVTVASNAEQVEEKRLSDPINQGKGFAR